ncbi:S1C family serine protease [Nocardia sp. CDC159]|uniref:S1C family serine protease n=1 Tax=Nocardia pulmonis TaxID=2951408 RepID=A0A9X2E7Q7_9NOCA|nr:MULTISPECIES: trypsin-like peptidase domain-containing protein [Nocardia]MCM6775814.1 S1C family serine protease [Nocardia pulmonis]MCM6788210.1 S1C family serine protease [Nocardia sp. CDC159]
MPVYPNQSGWPGQPPDPYGPPPFPPPPPRRARHGLGFTTLAALVLALAVTVGLVASRFSAHQLAPHGPLAQSQASALLPVDDPATPADLTAAVSQVLPGTALINTQLGLRNGEGAGTGIVLTSGGDVLTNNHVVEGATKIAVTVLGTGKTYSGSVVGYDRQDDLAVVRLSGASGLPTAPLGDSDRVRIGDAIVGLGNAGGTGTPTPAPGRVTALNRSITASDESTGSSEQLTGLIQVAADIQPGDSGGPLINAAGQVIGVNTAASQGFRMGTGGGEGFAIPINKARSIAEQIQAGRASDRVHIGPTAFLGVTVSDTNGSGAVVRDVVRGGPADQIGLAPGMVVTRIDDHAIDSATTLVRTMDRYRPGDTVTLTIVDRTGQTQTAQVKLARGPVG